MHELMHKHGGKYLARRGKTLNCNPLDTTLIALLKFRRGETNTQRIKATTVIELDIPDVGKLAVSSSSKLP
jgi:uncharacterized protein (DUF1330 family)